MVWAAIYFISNIGKGDSYDEKLARELVSIASISYCEQDEQITLSCGIHCDRLKEAGYTLLKSNTIQSTPFGGESYVIFYSKSKNRLVAAFRGTQNVLELLGEIFNSYSLEYELQPDVDDARVQGYFYTQYSVFMRTPFLEDMKAMKAKYPSADFFITGHSQGGAKATLAALDLVGSNVFKKDEFIVYTFGSPRVGNYEFAKLYRKQGPKTYRVVNNNDMVPHFPPCYLDKGQCVQEPDFDESMLFWCPYHVDEEVFYTNSNMSNQAYEFCSNEDMRCSNKYSIFNGSILSHLQYFAEPVTCSKTPMRI